jgi:hypothetical protein
MAQKLDDATKTGPVVFLDRNQKLHLPQLPAAPAANLQQKLAERLYCARSGNGHLRPGHRTAEPDRRWCRKPLKNIGASPIRNGSASGAPIGPKYAV